MILKDKFPQIKGLIFDMDGVLWKDNHPLLDLKSFFGKITDLGYLFALATNNATQNTSQYIEKLQQFGVDIKVEQILNSSMVTAHYLSTLYPGGGPVFMVGESGLSSTLLENGFYQAEENVVAVVAGLDRYFTYEKLRKATLLIRNGAPFIGTNPDKTFPTPHGLVPGAGAVLAAIEAATGVGPLLMGKPKPYMVELAISNLGTTPETTMVIGDRLDTDILAGQNAGCHTTLVLSGVTSQDEASYWSPAPDLILPDAGYLIMDSQSS